MLGFRVLGFQVLGFEGLGFRVHPPTSCSGCKDKRCVYLEHTNCPAIHKWG